MNYGLKLTTLIHWQRTLLVALLYFENFGSSSLTLFLGDLLALISNGRLLHVFDYHSNQKLLLLIVEILRASCIDVLFCYLACDKRCREEANNITLTLLGSYRNTVQGIDTTPPQIFSLHRQKLVLLSSQGVEISTGCRD